MQREGFGMRFAAALVDGVILVVFMFIVTLIFGGSILALFGTSAQRGNQTAATAAAGVSIVALILLALIPLAYSLMEVFAAATVGKMVLGLTIANEDGSRASMNTLLTRWGVNNSVTLLNFLSPIPHLI